MKTKTGTITWLILGFIWCIFMGVTFVSIGLGSLYPGLNLIAKPFVCPGGQTEVDTQHYQVSPGESSDILTWYCVDENSGEKTKLTPFIISLYAGPFYGLLIFLAIFIAWYFYKKWIPANETAESKKRAEWVKTILVILIIVGITLFNLIPLFRSFTPESTPAPNATASSLALTYEALTDGKASDFNATGKPLTAWSGIPIMPQAIAGQSVNDSRYIFQVPVDSGTIESFYHDTLKSLGWKLENDRWLGMQFSKDKRILLVTLAPAADTQSWIVTLLRIP